MMEKGKVEKEREQREEKGRRQQQRACHPFNKAFQMPKALPTTCGFDLSNARDT